MMADPQSVHSPLDTESVVSFDHEVELPIYNEGFNSAMNKGVWRLTLAYVTELFGSSFSQLVIVFAPTPLLWYLDDPRGPSKSQSTTSYLDGIRGFAAFAVFVQHFATPFQPSILGELNHQPFWSFFQLPVIRLFYSGSFAVAIFFAISGMALSLKPLSLVYQEEVLRCFETVSSSAFRRGIRIFLPAIVIAIIMMLGARFRLFDNDYPLSSYKKYNLDAPKHLPTFWAQLGDLLQFIFAKVFYPTDWLHHVPFTSPGVYGFQLWTISIEFWGSQILFVAIIGLSRCRRFYRNATVAGFISYSMWCMRWDICLFFCGMILADIKVHNMQSKRGTHSKGLSCKRLSNQVTPIVAFALGLYLGSVPDFNSKSTPGFGWFSEIIFFERFWQSLGALLALGAINQSQVLQWIFRTSVAQYLGHISFALYLVHVPIVSSIGWDIVPMMWSITGKNSTIMYELGVVLSFVLLCPLTIFCADTFWKLVDVPSVGLALNLERKFLSESASG